ncbi:hypothetical protein FM106_07000 [Brachybacterium faecium]|nr:hypothetical protein FM106_07000 [Brachybacterium faecium]
MITLFQLHSVHLKKDKSFHDYSCNFTILNRFFFKSVLFFSYRRLTTTY